MAPVTETLQRRTTVHANRLSKHPNKRWRAVSAAGLQGKGCQHKTYFFTDTGMSCRVVLCYASLH